MASERHARLARSFGAHADSYERARPGYPEAAARWLAPGSPRLVVELGAGTGKLTRALAALGHRVLAVEPDPRMRGVLDGLGLDGVRTADGHAEAIPARDGAADVVVSGSAFHWFDLDGVLAESARVLAPEGLLSFAWNGRDGRDPRMARLGELIHGGDPRAGGHIGRPWGDLVPASGLFGPVERERFEHEIELRRDEIPDLVRSYARVGARPPAQQAEIVARALDLFPDPVARLPFVVVAHRTAVCGRPPSEV
jgi:SAM-dependent methyltransferase